MRTLTDWQELVTDGQKNKLDYREPKFGDYHEKLAKQRLSKLRQIATSKNSQDRNIWADIYIKWLGGADAELVTWAPHMYSYV